MPPLPFWSIDLLAMHVPGLTLAFPFAGAWIAPSIAAVAMKNPIAM